MKAKTLGAVAVVMAAGVLIGVKEARRHSAGVEVAARASTPVVVLVADPREAGSECGCGQIIRRVREAKARGLDVQEIDPADPRATRYGVNVAPTVLILGPDGRVLERREGESSEVLAAISADLDALEAERR